MTDTVERPAVEATLCQRLRSVCPILLDVPEPAPDVDPLRDASRILDLLVRAVRATRSPDRIWLLCVAVSGTFPTPEDVIEGVRLFELESVMDATLWLLDKALDTEVTGTAAKQVRIVTDQVVVDVDHSARHDLHTGIQQVVRRTVPIWARDHDIAAVAWTSEGRALRTLSAQETRRALRWGVAGSQSTTVPAAEIVVPWRTVVVLAETPPREACQRLAAVAQYSGNAVVAIGYDCIPAISASLVPAAEPNRFARYLTVIKYARRVAAISDSATVEFRGIAQALPSQGLAGPAVVECRLPAQAIALPEADGLVPAPTDGTAGLPLVLSVGTFEPRKNHLAILHAAQRLWREGLTFELLFIGSSGWGEEIPRQIEQLRQRGRPIQTRTRVSDAELATAYRRARFTVFASLHEGYGLPVAESLSAGTPVITSDYGSMKEIGAVGGAVLIDPRDDEALVDAMRSLLTDEARVRSLREQIAARPVRTWEDYAAELWSALVQPELRTIGGRGPA